MIRHIVALSWVQDASPEQIQAVKDGLAKLPSEIETIRTYEFGSDAGLGGNFDFAVTATFDDAQGYKRYADHPAHQRVIQELIVPIRADRTAVQFEV